KNPEYQTSHSPRPGIALSSEEAREDFLLYVRIEQQRYQEYLRLKSLHPAIFLDRSIFTLLAYRFAIDIPADIFAPFFFRFTRACQPGSRSLMAPAQQKPHYSKSMLLSRPVAFSWTYKQSDHFFSSTWISIGGLPRRNS